MSPSVSILERVVALGGPLTTQDVLSRAVYASLRPAVRREMIRLKAGRRTPLGPHCTLTFENRATAWFQVHEELRFASRDDMGATLELLSTYNRLIPESGELRATLLIDTADRAVARSLSRLLALHIEALHVRLGARELWAQPLEPLGECIPGLAYVRLAPRADAQAGAWPSARWSGGGQNAVSPLRPEVELALRAELDGPTPARRPLARRLSCPSAR